MLASNVPAGQLSAKELWVVYRCRWQVESLFKRGKRQLGWAFSHGRTGARVLTEVLAKLLGLVVVLWATLLSGGPLAGRGPTKQGEVVRRFAWRVAGAVAEVAALGGLGRLEQELGRLPPPIKRHKRPSTRQLLQQPSLVA